MPIDWWEYERLKNNWIASHPEATPREYEAACQEAEKTAIEKGREK